MKNLDFFKNASTPNKYAYVGLCWLLTESRIIRANLYHRRVPTTLFSHKNILTTVLLEQGNQESDFRRWWAVNPF